MLGRRAFVTGLGGAGWALLGSPLPLPAAGAITPASSDLETMDLVLAGDPRLARRALLLVPRHLPKNKRVPLLVLLHGLGETGNELLGIHAWGERYGLVRAYERLRHPPLTRTLPRQRYFTNQRLEELNRALERRPFGGLAMVCPVTPNPARTAAPERTLDRYTDWIHTVLLPNVLERAPIIEGPGALGLDGCSLGGYVAAEVFLRQPGAWATFGSVQGAFGVAQARRYAERFAEAFGRVGRRPIHLESSSGDPFLGSNRAFSRRLTELGVEHTLIVPPGPHDQPWLREVGTLEMLLWHQRALTTVRG